MRSIDPARVAIYIRWSTEDQGQGHTLAIQSEACRHYCLSQGWQVQDRLTYVDDGWSGGTLDRPALAQLRADAAAGRVHAVVVYKLDRLSRNIKDIVALVLDEWEGRCAVRSTMEPIDTSSDTGKLTFTLLSSFADFERGTIRARTLGGKRKNAEQGRNAGAPYPYGYERGDQAGTYRVVESEAAVVRMVFDLYQKGMGCKGIAYHLNGLGIQARTEGPGPRRLTPGKWSSTGVHRILRNPIYTGHLVYSRHSRNPRQGREGERYYLKNDPAVVIRVPSPHIPAIIDSDTFAKVERILAAKRSPNFARRAVSSPHLLTGLVFCRCGHTLVGRKSSAKTGAYYWCSGRKDKGAGVCPSGMIRAEGLDQEVLARLGAVYGNATAAMTPEWQEAINRRRETLARLLQSAGDELARVRQAQERLAHDYTGGAVTGAAYQHLYTTLADRAQQLENARQEAERQVAEIAGEARLYRDRAEAFLTLRDSFDELTQASKKLLLQHLVHRIEAYREQGSRQVDLQIEWTGPGSSSSFLPHASR